MVFGDKSHITKNSCPSANGVNPQERRKQCFGIAALLCHGCGAEGLSMVCAGRVGLRGASLRRKRLGRRAWGSQWGPALPMAAASTQHLGHEYEPGKRQFINENRAEELLGSGQSGASMLVWSRDVSLSPHPRTVILGAHLLISEAIPGQTHERDSACSYLKLKPLHTDKSTSLLSSAFNSFEEKQLRRSGRGKLTLHGLLHRMIWTMENCIHGHALTQSEEVFENRIPTSSRGA